MGELKSGTRIGGWTLDERVGVGGLAEVWSAHPDGEGRPAALKILLDPSRSSQHRARFLREGRLLQRHPNGGLPRCLDVLDLDPPALVLELLEGSSLSDHLAESGPLPPDRAEAIAAALLQVLDHLHQRGIIHRDIKPANVWLGENRRVLLLDLGLASDPADPLTTTLGDVMGTYAYMAPEQISGGDLDARADLYSLGITLYEALAGDRPFYAQGIAGYLQAHLGATFTPIRELRPDAPERLLDLVARLMARDPLARPPSAPVARALLTGATGAVGRLRAAPLVGRAGALGAIEGVLDAGGCVFLVGEVGAGGARMAREALKMARERHMEVLAIRCRTRTPALDPLDQLARDLTAISGPVEASPEALARALDALHGESGVLVVVEDLDQTQPDARWALHNLLGQVSNLPVVMTGREVEAPGHRVELRPLGLAETRRLLVGMLGARSPPAGLADRLLAISGGLPAVQVLAVREMVELGSLWSEGVGHDGHPLWRLDRKAALLPAAGLDSLFGDLLGLLQADALRLLRCLAVAGEPLGLEVALTLAEAHPDGDAAFELRRAGLVALREERDRDTIEILRAPVATLVLRDMEEAERRLTHRRLAQILAAAPGSARRDARLAWHEAHGAPPEDAARALLALGEDMHRRGRDLEAIDVLDRATTTAGPDPALAAALAVARGEVLDGAGRWEEAVNALVAGLQLARSLGDEPLATRALVATASAWRALGDEARAADLAEQALARLEGQGSDPSLPRALLLAAAGQRLRAQPAAARALYQQCIEAALRMGDRRSVALAHAGIGVLIYEDGNPERALRELERAAGWLRRRGPRPQLVPTLVGMANAWRCSGRPDRAVDALLEAEDATRFANGPYARALVRVGQAALHLALWDLGEASRRLSEARDALDPDAPAVTRHAYREVQGQLRLARGDRQAALSAFQSGEAEARAAGHQTTRAWFLGMCGVLTADAEALNDAMAVLAVAGERRLAARLLLQGALAGGDAEVLASAEAEARESGDRYLLLEVLHASGTSRALAEAIDLVEAMLAHTPTELQAAFLAAPMVRWTAAAARARHRAPPGPTRR